MPTTFERCDKSVDALAKSIIGQHEEHKPLSEFKARIDFVFAHSDNDKPALKKGGIPALGIARKLSLKDRALGRGDAEIALDGFWWKNANEQERRALLDHELYHLSVDVEKGEDDLGRPKIKMRKHDFEFGWFRHIAKRYGEFSMERKQAKYMMEDCGQLLWPEICKEGAIDKAA